MKYLGSWEEVVQYYNNEKIHKSLYVDRIINSGMAYEMKKNEDS